MKRVLLLLLIVGFSVFCMAQNKKVAVWETKCSDKSITSFQSTMVRGGMEAAVANASGYTGYDRASFDAIIKEHNFQRSGSVKDSDIKRLGEMAGVQYIIVPEALASGDDFYIIVKMLDVETGEFGAAYDALCGSSAAEIKKTCSELGGKLFGGGSGNFYTSTSPNNRPQPQSANEHKYVDLGLPSGTLWATCNVGADEPEDYGSYYAWGETSIKSIYNMSTYRYANGDHNRLTKYCNDSEYGDNGFIDGLTQLQVGDDPAAANWDSRWRIPSVAQWEELMNNTTQTWTTRNGVKGRLFTAKNGESIFLPASGRRCNGELGNVGKGGYYWSRSLRDGCCQYDAYYLGFFYSSVCFVDDDGYREYGFSVRPVREK